MRLKIKLLSDSMAGSGEGIPGIVDGDIQYDEFGIPHISSKRIKGILRESAQEILDIGRTTEEEIRAIFGVSGEFHDYSLKLSNGYLQNNNLFREFLKSARDQNISNFFSPSLVLEYYTYLRTQTSVDRKTGSAKENSLRTMRVLRKGLEFYFEIEFPTEHQDLMENICRVTRRFGMNRTRGLGEIQVDLEDNDVEINEVPSKSKAITKDTSEEIYALIYTLYNLNPLLLCLSPGKDTVSEDYIPGGMIAGAFASRFIKKYPLTNTGNNENEEKFKDLFISGKVKFLNAYIADQYGARFSPMPASIVKIKNTEQYLDLSVPSQIQEKTKRANGYIKGNKKTTPNKYVEYHHQRPSDRSIGHAFKRQTGDKEGEFFQYEALSPNQHFSGIILGPKECLEELKILIPDKAFLYLGKSKTAQYGKTKIQYLKYTLFEGEAFEEHEIWENGKTINIILTSPMILLNSETGYTEPDPQNLMREISEKTGYSLSIEKRFLKFTTVGGFLNKWKLPKIQSRALDAGTVLVLKNTANIAIEVSKIIKHSYGIRIEEGMGRIEIYYPEEEFSFEKLEDSTFVREDITPLRDFIQFILDEHLKNRIQKKVYEQKHQENRHFKIPSSFINKLQGTLKNCPDFSILKEKFKLFRSSAKNHLSKIAKSIYIRLLDSGEGITIEEDKFREDILCQLPVAKESPEIRSVLKKLDLDENPSRLTEYECFRLYVETYLNLIKWKNRKIGSDADGKEQK